MTIADAVSLWLCADCGSRRAAGDRPHPLCCGWEMIRLPLLADSPLRAAARAPRAG